MNIFKNYTQVIEKALKRRDLKKGFDNFEGIGSINESYQGEQFKEDRKGLVLETDNLEQLANSFGATQILNQRVGHHPDFLHLKNSGLTENHYIVSAFIDIKNSTSLYRRYDNQTIYMITNTIQLAAIAVCSYFGGFIQRIQGDGVFVYFGKKGLNEEDAVKHAVIATSIFTNYVKHELRELFDSKGIEPINTKIGLDIGEDSKVLWAMAGINETSEITTYSLHTSLASKMQEYAKSNEIIVGQNIKDLANNDDSFYNAVEEKRYIFENPDEGFRYTQYKFNWSRFITSLKSYGFTPNLEEIKEVPQVMIANRNERAERLKELAGKNRPYLGKV